MNASGMQAYGITQRQSRSLADALQNRWTVKLGG